MVYCRMFLFPWIRACPLNHRTHPSVLGSGRCCPTNGLLLCVFISSDPNTATGPSSLSRCSQIRALASPLGEWFIVLLFYFLGSGHGHLIIGSVSASFDPDVAARQTVYCCVFLFLWIQTRPLHHHLCPGVLRSRHWHLRSLNGLLLNYFIFFDLGTVT